MPEEFSDEELEEICGKVYDWGVEFSKSEYFKDLTKEQKRESEAVIMFFTEYMYSCHGLTPEEWDEDSLEECCLYTLVRKISADEPFYRSIAPVLMAFFAFTEEKKLLRNSLALARRVKELNQRIIERASDPRNWGLAKSLIMAAKMAGIDVHDEKELNKFITFINMQAMKGPQKLKHIKIGRNQPCPCGSGKKYKKCCGSDKDGS